MPLSTFILAASFLLWVSASGAAECVTADHFACLTREGFDKAILALLINDQGSFYAAGCDFTEPGYKVEVLGPVTGLGQLVAIFYGHSPVTKPSGIADIFRASASPSGWAHVWTIEQNIVCRRLDFDF
jgi:hypothetical protein